MRSFLLLAFLACLAISEISAQGKVKVSVYYEVLCPDSKDFVTKQLFPVFNGPLRDSVQIDLVPYGKATTKKTPDGSFEFKCQHGPSECVSNMFHACSIKLYGVDKTVPYANCMMSKSRPANFAEECAKTTGLDFSQLKACQSGKQGPSLLAEMGDRTKALSPKMVFVPWITFNGVFSQKDETDAQDDLAKVICSKLVGQKPNGC